MLDPTGHIASWNAGAERFKGYAAQEVIGRHFSIFYTDEDIRSGIPVTALQTSERTGKFEAEGWRVRKDGTRFWAHVIIDPIVSPAGELLGFTKVTRDLTERREAQQHLDAAREALFQSQKMDAIGKLTGGVAHDFNNLLTAVLGSLELVQRRIGDDPRVAPLVANAVQAARRGAVLTQRMLAFARRQALNPEAVTIPALVSDMTDMLDRSLGSNITIVVRFPPAMDAVLVDRNQLEMAVMNLAFNARDAMPRGGAITIEAHEIGGPQCLGVAFRPLRRALGCRPGRGHGRADAATGDRALLHDQGRGQGHRARPLHGPWPGGAIRRAFRAKEQARRRYNGQSLVPAPRRRGGQGGPGRPGRRPRRPRAHPGGDHAFALAKPLSILAVDDDALVLMNTAAMRSPGHNGLFGQGSAQAPSGRRGV